MSGIFEKHEAKDIIYINIENTVFYGFSLNYPATHLGFSHYLVQILEWLSYRYFMVYSMGYDSQPAKAVYGFFSVQNRDIQGKKFNNSTKLQRKKKLHLI